MICDTIKELRERAGLSQAALAKKVGVTRLKTEEEGIALKKSSLSEDFSERAGGRFVFAILFGDKYEMNSRRINDVFYHFYIFFRMTDDINVYAVFHFVNSASLNG